MYDSSISPIEAFPYKGVSDDLPRTQLIWHKCSEALNVAAHYRGVLMSKVMRLECPEDTEH